MSSRKKIQRARRQTLGMLAEAEVALARGEAALAHKLVGRALEVGAMNARVHADAALLLLDLGRRGEAEAAAWRARELAPAAPFVAVVCTELGLQTSPDAHDATSVGAIAPALAPCEPQPTRPWSLPAALAALLQTGVASATGWMTPHEAATLAALPADASLFSAARALATPAGVLEWASCKSGAMPWLDAVLAEAYARAADLANALQGRLGADTRFPSVCGDAPAHVDRAVRLSLRDGASLPPRQDRGDRPAFGLRACLALGPAPASVVVVDVRPGKRRERAVEVPCGGVAWFCARERPVHVGGVLGLQGVAWGLCSPADAALVLTSWLDVVGRAPAPG